MQRFPPDWKLRASSEFMLTEDSRIRTRSTSEIVCGNGRNQVKVNLVTERQGESMHAERNDAANVAQKKEGRAKEEA